PDGLRFRMVGSRMAFVQRVPLLAEAVLSVSACTSYTAPRASHPKPRLELSLGHRSHRMRGRPAVGGGTRDRPDTHLRSTTRGSGLAIDRFDSLAESRGGIFCHCAVARSFAHPPAALRVGDQAVDCFPKLFGIAWRHGDRLDAVAGDLRNGGVERGVDDRPPG